MNSGEGLITYHILNTSMVLRIGEGNRDDQAGWRHRETESLPTGSYLEFTDKRLCMRINHVGIRLMFLGVVVTVGCNSQSPVNPSPGTGQANAGGTHADAPNVAKPSPGLSQPAVAPSPSASDSLKVAGSPSATDGSTAVLRAQNQSPQASGSASSSSDIAPKASVIPSDEQIAKWGISKFEPLGLLACRDGFADTALLDMAITPSGKQFIAAGLKLTLWNAKDPQPASDLLATYKDNELERPLLVAAVSDDGKWIAAGDQKGRVRIWSLGDQRETLMLPATRGRVTQLAFAPNSRLLATTSDSGDVDLWPLPDGKPMKSVKIGKETITRMVFVSDNVLATVSNETSLWDVSIGKKVTDLTPKRVRDPALALSRDRKLLAFNDSDSNLQFWDVVNSRLTGVTVPGIAPGLAAFSPDGNWIATYSGDSAIRILDTTKGRVLQVIDADGDRTTALEWFPNANVLLVASLDGRIRMWGTADGARSIGIDPMPLPVSPATATALPNRSLSSAQFQQVIDLRSLPRLPGAVSQWTSFAACSYTAPASQEEATLFHRYVLDKSGWSEVAGPAGPGALVFRKENCQLTVAINPAYTGGDKNVQISLSFTGNYDARWLPKISPIPSKSVFDSFSMVMYRTKASLIDTEVALLRQFHEAGWTAYSRLAASDTEDPNSRRISMLQGGSLLSVSISHPADSPDELVVQAIVSVSNKTLPIPADSGWIEFDNSSDLQLVLNTKMDLSHAVQYFDETMVADGWLARQAGRQIKDDKGWLPYIRGQKDVRIRLSARPGGGTRIVVGDAQRTSWQFQSPVEAKKSTDKPTLEAADFVVPNGAKAVNFAVDQKQIEFEVADTTPPKLSGQIATQMEGVGWKRTTAGVSGDDYVLMIFANGKSEIELRARASGNATKVMIGGNGLSWAKPLPIGAVPISYGTWLRRNRKDATLDRLDEFAAEMHKTQPNSPSQRK